MKFRGTNFNDNCEQMFKDKLEGRGRDDDKQNEAFDIQQTLKEEEEKKSKKKKSAMTAPVKKRYDQMQLYRKEGDFDADDEPNGNNSMMTADGMNEHHGKARHSGKR